ncbi:hypothetical protein Ate02nite_20490 [Paractinoplanes tereljensis]|uniref:Uncharacterized protein n=1 Tax=Paractinoplanes tereljensis TaxID=571912 RepID=A0A919NJR3_9ACTN|nr:hypothetical protein Ate02nite_20490 [Actinoplanes tereljensis]
MLGSGATTSTNGSSPVRTISWTRMRRPHFAAGPANGIGTHRFKHPDAPARQYSTTRAAPEG